MSDPVSFGRWLKQCRKALGLTQHDLARRVGCALITIQKIEADARRPSVQIAELLADRLEIAPEERPAFLAAARKNGQVAPSPLAAVRDQPPHQPARAPSNLPTPPTPLIGREAESGAVSTLLLRDTVRLVTLSGAPGIGKTRLGIHVASQLQDAFAGGVHFIALASTREPELVANTIAQAIGVREAAQQSFWDVLKDTLHDKQMLLLLDNFEQVLAAAPMLADLLARCPQLKLLVTSRAVLHLSGEYEFSVPPLALPDSQPMPAPAELMKYSAVELFTQRVQALTADFALTAENVPVIVEICQHLDGIPLAIELAAARGKLFAPPALLRRLNDRLTLLTSGPQDLPARQRTLRDAIGWSYDLLDTSEQTLFRRLAVFVGGCRLAAVEAVCNADNDLGIAVLDGVASLVDKSLLQRETDTDDEPRFTMLETIREYGLEQLDASGETEIVRHHHAAHYLQFAQTAEPELKGEQQIVWMTLLAREHDNLRAALQWAIDADEVETAAHIAVALRFFWYIRGHMIEGRCWLEAVLERSSTLPLALRAKALQAMGSVAGNQGDFDTARSCLAASLRLYRSLGNTYQIAEVLASLGMVSLNQGNDEQATRFIEECLGICRAYGYKRNMAVALNNLGGIKIYQREYEQAAAHLEEALMVMREIQDTSGVAIVLHSLGMVTYMRGDYYQAHILLIKSLQLNREIESVRGMLACLEGLAVVTGAQRHLEPATRLHGAVEALINSTGATISEPIAGTIPDDAVKALRAQLDAATFAALWAEGQAMTMENAIAEALCIEA